MLIRAAVRMGAIAAGATDRQLDDLTGYAEDIGLAFQIADDVLECDRHARGIRQESQYRRRTRQENLSDLLWRRRREESSPTTASPAPSTGCHPSVLPPIPSARLARYITSRKN